MSRAVGALYRARGIIYFCAAAVLILNVAFARFLPDGPATLVARVLSAVAIAGVVLVLTLIASGKGRAATPITHAVASPVTGRWVGLNSPASAVPSHGVRMYGQAYAVDLIHDPSDNPRPIFGEGKAMRSPADYPAFGQPVRAMVSGVVVRASGWRRDHLSRTTNAAVAYLMAEGALREVGGPGFILGNHVTIRRADGVFATVAHLQQHSLTVTVGDTVEAGDLVGRCGNSGNTSEPHVHAQLMDRANPLTGQGLPMSFAGITLDEDLEQVDAIPANGQHMSA